MFYLINNKKQLFWAFFIANIPDNNEVISCPTHDQTELTHHQYVAMSLNIIFRKTKLEIKV